MTAFGQRAGVLRVLLRRIAVSTVAFLGHESRRERRGQGRWGRSGRTIPSPDRGRAAFNLRAEIIDRYLRDCLYCASHRARALQPHEVATVLFHYAVGRR